MLQDLKPIFTKIYCKYMHITITMLFHKISADSCTNMSSMIIVKIRAKIVSILLADSGHGEFF